MNSIVVYLWSVMSSWKMDWVLIGCEKSRTKQKRFYYSKRSLMIKSTSFLCIKNHVFKNSHYNNLWDIHWKLARNLKTKPKFFSHRKNSHKVLRFKIRCKLLPVQESRYCFFNTFKMWIQKMLYHKNTKPMSYFLNFPRSCFVLAVLSLF